MKELETPQSLRVEHEEIFRELRGLAATKNDTGSEAKKLLAVLEPHFEKEEETAMPLLGALKPLSGGRPVERSEVLYLAGRLAKEYPTMLKEHAEVGRLIEGVRRAASKSNDERGLTLMDQLAHHAAIEEEVLYPAATLAGMIAKSLEEARTR